MRKQRVATSRFLRHVKPFLHFFENFFGAGMPAAAAGNRECLNFRVRHQLTSYDALYLETALATGLPLATRDKALQQAARECGVGVWGL